MVRAIGAMAAENAIWDRWLAQTTHPKEEGPNYLSSSCSETQFWTSGSRLYGISHPYRRYMVSKLDCVNVLLGPPGLPRLVQPSCYHQMYTNFVWDPNAVIIYCGISVCTSCVHSLLCTFLPIDCHVHTHHGAHNT